MLLEEKEDLLGSQQLLLLLKWMSLTLLLLLMISPGDVDDKDEMVTLMKRVESIDGDVTMNLTSTAAPPLLLATLCPLWAGNCPAPSRVSLLAGRPAVRLVTLLVICWLPAARLTSARLASVFILSKLASSTRPTPRSSSSLYKWISVGTL